MNIDIEVKSVLESATFTPDSVQLNGTLDRALYIKTNKIIELAGGKWDRKRKAHIFGEDPARVLGVGVATGVLDPTAVDISKIKAPLSSGIQSKIVPQLFPTPMPLAEQMVDLAEIENGMRICEPSAGTGNILQAIVDGFKRNLHIATTIRAIEINPQLAQSLATRFQGAPSVMVAQHDFLDWGIDGDVAVYGYDRVLMNPPFANGQDIAHITHAMKLLKPGGKIVAICANGPRQNDKLKPIIEASGGVWEVLPPDTFKESGTGVNTVLMTYTRQE